MQIGPDFLVQLLGIDHQLIHFFAKRVADEATSHGSLMMDQQRGLEPREIALTLDLPPHIEQGFHLAFDLALVHVTSDRTDDDAARLLRQVVLHQFSETGSFFARIDLS